MREKKILSLDSVPMGSDAKIIKIMGEGRFKTRLMEMGFIKDAILETIKPAPLGDPIELKLKGYNLTIRKEDARKIYVEILKKRKKNKSFLSQILQKLKLTNKSKKK